MAINKVLALVGRDEARDFIDVHYVNGALLGLGGICWAACGKDPGFNPLSLLELLKRRGKYRPEQIKTLKLTIPMDLMDLKTKWLDMLKSAERFIESAPALEAGRLYYSLAEKKFFEPRFSKAKNDYVLHFGKPGGVLPKFKE